MKKAPKQGSKAVKPKAPAKPKRDAKSRPEQQPGRKRAAAVTMSSHSVEDWTADGLQITRTIARQLAFQTIVAELGLTLPEDRRTIQIETRLGSFGSVTIELFALCEKAAECVLRLVSRADLRRLSLDEMTGRAGEAKEFGIAGERAFVPASHILVGQATTEAVRVALATIRKHTPEGLAWLPLEVIVREVLDHRAELKRRPNQERMNMRDALHTMLQGVADEVLPPLTASDARRSDPVETPVLVAFHEIYAEVLPIIQALKADEPSAFAKLTARHCNAAAPGAPSKPSDVALRVASDLSGLTAVIGSVAIETLHGKLRAAKARSTQ